MCNLNFIYVFIYCFIIVLLYGGLKVKAGIGETKVHNSESETFSFNPESGCLRHKMPLVKRPQCIVGELGRDAFCYKMPVFYV